MFTWGNGSFVVSSFIYVPSLNPKLFQLENLKKTCFCVCVDQERNIFNRIFGGFLMRKAYELGWANACSYG